MGVLGDSHAAALAKIRCGPGTIIVKNESSDLMQREYTLYAPRIEDPTAAKKDDNFDDRPYIISIPLRKSENPNTLIKLALAYGDIDQKAFEASLVQFLSNQAARCLADGVIPESRWVRWENDVAISPSGPHDNGETHASWNQGSQSSRTAANKPTRGRVLVACSVRLGISAESTIKSMNIRYVPPNNSDWSDGMPVRSVMIIQYRSIRKQKLYQMNEEDPTAWQDGDYLKLFLEFAKVSEYFKEQKSLRCDFVWEEKIRVMGPAVTFKVRDLRHFEDDTPVEGVGTYTFLGDRVTLTAGAATGEIKLDRWNLPKVLPNRKAPTNESAFLVAWTQPLHEQLRNFWAVRLSRREEIKGTFHLNTISVKGRPDIFGQEFYASQLVVLHDKTTRSTRIVVRSASGTCVLSQDVSDRKSTKMDLQDDTISVDEPMANITNLVPGREKDGPSLKVRQEPNTINYQFSDEQDAVACICMITELGRTELVTETMALEDGMVTKHVSGVSTPIPPSETTDLVTSTSPPSQYIELPTNHIRKMSIGQAPVFDASKGYELDVEIFLDESHQIILCPHATVNPALFLSFDAIGQASLPLFALNVTARDLNIELYIQCLSPRMERQFEDIMASLLRMRVATNLAIVGMRPSKDLISVHAEDSDIISVLEAFGNIEISPSADIRIDGQLRVLSKATKEVSISQHRTVRRNDLADRLSSDPNQHSHLFDGGGRSMLQFKAGDKNFTCFIKGAPRLHVEAEYITLTMQVDDAALASENNPGSLEERLGSGRLRLRFDGGGRSTRSTASQSYGWFNFWRNRLKMKRWFKVDDDEEEEYTVGIEEVALETETPNFFDGFFNNGKLILLKNSELDTARILVQSFSNDRILSQAMIPSNFTKQRSLRAAIGACCVGERAFAITQDCAVADRSRDTDPRCWRLTGKTSYIFPTSQIRDLFCDNLAAILGTISGRALDAPEGVFELESSNAPTPRGHQPTAVELPAFEFSMPTLLRRATIGRGHPIELDDNDGEDSDVEPVPLLDRDEEDLYSNPRPAQLSRDNFLDTNKTITPSRSFGELKLSPVITPEPQSRSKTPSPKPLVIPPPPPLPAFPEELTATPVETRKNNIFSSPQSAYSSPRDSSSSLSRITSTTSTTSGRSMSSSLASPSSTNITSATSLTSNSTFRQQTYSRSPSRSSNRNVTYRVWAQYDAKKDGEINVSVGDIIKVDHEGEDGDAVWGVKLHSKERAEGWVPKWCLTQEKNLDFNMKGKRRRGENGSGEWGF
ncbi:hypothetical protein ABW19_dt0206959 [Dactylella cylindrospora]|nr:hypothetical protein ABW19_dt0206959 [Dactylella cylindrospora]